MTRTVVGLHKTLKQNILSYVKWSLQYRSNCFGVSDDLKQVGLKELKSVSFGERSFHVANTR